MKAGQKTQPDALTPEQVHMVFEQIASTALTVRNLLGILQVDALDDESDCAAVVTAAELLTGRMGLLAELYGPRCGAQHPILVNGEADAWLMPRAFVSPLQS